MEVRTCNFCKEEKQLKLFKKEKKTKTGYGNICLLCSSARVLKHKHEKKRKKYYEEFKHQEFSIKKCIKHGYLKPEDILLTVVRINEPYLVHLRCFLCEKEKRYNNTHMHEAYIQREISNTIYCCRCKETKEFKDFHKHQLSRYSPTCKRCRRSYAQDNWKKSVLKCNYDLTLDEFNAMKKNQNDLCSICNLEEQKKFNPDRKDRDLSVDHNHETGKVRALLCRSCNLMIGNSYENSDILRKAAAYLDFHNENP